MWSGLVIFIFDILEVMLEEFLCYVGVIMLIVYVILMYVGV